jgi:hypothetical protein
MKIGDLSRRPDRVVKMQRMNIEDRRRINRPMPTGENEAKDDMIHTLLKEGLKSVTPIAVTTLVAGTSETDIPGREAHPQADSDGLNAKLKTLNEGKNATQRE